MLRQFTPGSTRPEWAGELRLLLAATPLPAHTVTAEGTWGARVDFTPPSPTAERALRHSHVEGWIVVQPSTYRLP